MRRHDKLRSKKPMFYERLAEMRKRELSRPVQLGTPSQKEPEQRAPQDEKVVRKEEVVQASVQAPPTGGAEEKVAPVVREERKEVEAPPPNGEAVEERDIGGKVFVSVTYNSALFLFIVLMGLLAVVFALGNWAGRRTAESGGTEDVLWRLKLTSFQANETKAALRLADHIEKAFGYKTVMLKREGNTWSVFVGDFRDPTAKEARELQEFFRRQEFEGRKFEKCVLVKDLRSGT